MQLQQSPRSQAYAYSSSPLCAPQPARGRRRPAPSEGFLRHHLSPRLPLLSGQAEGAFRRGRRESRHSRPGAGLDAAAAAAAANFSAGAHRWRLGSSSDPVRLSGSRPPSARPRSSFAHRRRPAAGLIRRFASLSACPPKSSLLPRGVSFARPRAGILSPRRRGRASGGRAARPPSAAPPPRHVHLLSLFCRIVAELPNLVVAQPGA